ncbi:MAG TPA: TetR/AcrR family transcriptional regulator [Actinomycetota bacterium]|jgi:AcrR family transcriptional regulator
MSTDAQATPGRARQRARRGHGERLREEILAAATRLLFETGDEDAVSIRAIAAAVGVTTPSIYLHFADKTELIWAVCEEHFRKLDEELERAAAGSDDPLESLRLRGRAYVRFGLDNAEGYRILFMSRGDLEPKEDFDGDGTSAAAFVNLVGAVEGCMDAGAIRRDDPSSVAFGLWALVHGVTSLLIAHPHFPWPTGPDELVDMILDHHLEGLRPSPAGAPTP